MIGERYGRYQSVAPISQGGTENVLLARAGRDAPFVALKILDERTHSNQDGQIAMFMDEASIMSQVVHQNVLRVFDFGRDHGRYYIATEYLQGQTVARILEAARDQGLEIDLRVLAFIGARAARGLHAAHMAVGAGGVSLGVVHRDVNLETLFVTYDGLIKVIDFGMARANQRFTRTAAGVFKGTAAYLSPEQVHERPVSGRSDVFALGVCLWEMASGRRLFLRHDEFETMRAVVEAPIEPPTGGADPRFDEIVFTCLERRAPERPDAGELAAELIAYAQSRPPPATDDSVANLIQGLFPRDYIDARTLLDRFEVSDEAAKQASTTGDLYAVPPERRGGAVKSAVDALATNLAPVQAAPPTQEALRPWGRITGGILFALLIAAGAVAVYWFWIHSSL